MEKHNLHVKIDDELKQRLIKLKQDLEVRSVSRLVKDIVARCMPVLEQRYFEDEEQASHYRLVNDNLAIERVSLHVYLKEADYRWLKQNHQDLNFFSIAQIVRWLIGWGVDLLELGVEEANRQWQKIAQAWEKKRRKIRSQMERVRQLFPLFLTRSQEFGWVSIYNRNFSPLRKIFLKC